MAGLSLIAAQVSAVSLKIDAILILILCVHIIFTDSYILLSANVVCSLYMQTNTYLYLHS